MNDPTVMLPRPEFALDVDLDAHVPCAGWLDENDAESGPCSQPGVWLATGECGHSDALCEGCAATARVMLQYRIAEAICEECGHHSLALDWRRL